MLRSHHLRFIETYINALYVVGSCRCGAARASRMSGGVSVGMDDQWHSGGSLLLCSVAHCPGVGACSQVDYPGMFGCICGRETKDM
jgi:hypothetical protein